MSNAALAFLAGLGQGYFDQQDANERKAREKKREEREDEQYEFQKAERERLKREREAIAAAGRDVTVNENAAALDLGGAKPVIHEDPDMAAADYRQARTMGMEGVQAPRKVAAVQGIEYADPAAAKKAAEEANTPQARAKRVAAAYYGIGDAGRAIQVESSARQAEAADLTLQLQKEAADRDRAMRDMVTKFKKSGWAGLPKLYESYNDGNTATVQEDGKGGAVITVIGPDGKPMGQQHYASQLDFLTDALAQFDPKLYLDAVDKQAGRKHQAATLAETTRHNQATEKNAAALTDARIDAATARAEAARAKATGAAPAAFDPLANVDHKTLLSEAAKQAAKEAQEASAAGKPMSAAQQAQRAQQVYQGTLDAIATENANRERVRVFKTVAAGAKTPEDLAAVRERAKASGFSDEEMARIDQRFAPPKKPAPKPAPASKPAAAAGIPAPATQAPTDPLAAQFAKESSELNRGTRTDFSPEVKAYIEQQKQKDAAAAEAYRLRDFQRAQSNPYIAASRGGL